MLIIALEKLCDTFRILISSFLTFILILYREKYFERFFPYLLKIDQFSDTFNNNFVIKRYTKILILFGI